MAGDDPTLPGILRNRLNVLFLFYRLKKESSRESSRIGRLAATQGEDHAQTLANKTRNLDAAHPHFLKVFMPRDNQHENARQSG
jgi:hypothetical protein